MPFPGPRLDLILRRSSLRILYTVNRRGWTRTIQGSIPIVKAIERCRARPWSTMPVLGQLINCPVRVDITSKAIVAVEVIGWQAWQ